MNSEQNPTKRYAWTLLIYALIICMLCSGMSCATPKARLVVAIIGCGAFDMLVVATIWLAYIYRKRRTLVFASIGVVLALLNFLIFAAEFATYRRNTLSSAGKHLTLNHQHLQFFARQQTQSTKGAIPSKYTECCADAYNATTNEYECCATVDLESLPVNHYAFGGDATTNFLANAEELIDMFARFFLEYCEYDFVPIMTSTLYGGRLHEARKDSLLFEKRYQAEVGGFINKMKTAIESGVGYATKHPRCFEKDMPLYGMRSLMPSQPFMSFGGTNAAAIDRALSRLHGLRRMHSAQERIYKEGRALRLALLQMRCRMMLYEAYMRRLPGRDILEAFDMTLEIKRWEQAAEEFRTQEAQGTGK